MRVSLLQGGLRGVPVHAHDHEVQADSVVDLQNQKKSILAELASIDDELKSMESSTVCPPGQNTILDAGTCSQAAQSLGLLWEGESWWNDWQGGCFQRTTTKQAFYNTNPNGVPNAEGASICLPR